MYGEKEYAKKIKELEPLAVECLAKKGPKETREIAVKMDPEDIYIFGVLIGGIMNMINVKHVETIEVTSFDRPLKGKNSKKRRKNDKEDIEEKSEKEIEEKSEKEIEEKSDEKSEKEIEEKSDNYISGF